MKNLIIYKSHWELIEQLSVEQVGNLMKGIAKFCKDEEVTFTDPILTGIWMMMKRDFIVQGENYEKKKAANRRNGLKGGRPKQTEDKPENPMGYLETEQTQPNPQNLKDKDKDKDKDIEKEKERDIEKEKDSIVDQAKLSREDICADALTSTLELKKIITHSKSESEKKEKVGEIFDKLFYE